MNILKFRILATANLICVGVFLLSSSPLWARGKRSDQDICAGKEAVFIADCTKRHSLSYCAGEGEAVYQNCMDARGHPNATRGGDYPTPPPNKIHPIQPPPTVGNNPGTAPTPGGSRVHPIQGPVTSKGPISSPTPTPQTIYAKPKSSPSAAPHPSHHSGHHG
jgi:hypothetical protein